MAPSSSSVFQWGEREAGSEKSYERMFYKGVWFSVLDCVEVRSDAVLPHVGKLMRLYEEDGKRKVRVRWFLRAAELPYQCPRGFLKRTRMSSSSLKGALKETIIRKVTVLCTARSPRNPQPSQRHVDEADYIFNRVYDAAQRKLVKFERIDRNLAMRLGNKEEWLSPR